LLLGAFFVVYRGVRSQSGAAHYRLGLVWLVDGSEIAREVVLIIVVMGAIVVLVVSEDLREDTHAVAARSSNGIGSLDLLPLSDLFFPRIEVASRNENIVEHALRLAVLRWLASVVTWMLLAATRLSSLLHILLLQPLLPHGFSRLRSSSGDSIRSVSPALLIVLTLAHLGIVACIDRW